MADYAATPQFLELNKNINYSFSSISHTYNQYIINKTITTTSYMVSLWLYHPLQNMQAG